jgi:hypothetical protein
MTQVLTYPKSNQLVSPISFPFEPFSLLEACVVIALLQPREFPMICRHDKCRLRFLFVASFPRNFPAAVTSLSLSRFAHQSFMSLLGNGGKTNERLLHRARVGFSVEPMTRHGTNTWHLSSLPEKMFFCRVLLHCLDDEDIALRMKTVYEGCVY